jgi:outer membrane protein assembly factor BamB
MFHVKHRAAAWLARRRRAALAGVVALFALLAAGCATNLGNPDGWAAPVLVEGLVLLQERPGELVAVRVGDGPTRVAWRFPEDAALPAGIDRDDIDLDAVYATPIVDGDAVYIAGYSGDVLAIDVEGSGPRVRWLRTLENRVVGTPAYDAGAGILYVPTEGGELLPIATDTGTVGATLAMGSERFWSQPALGGGSIYVAGLDHRVRAIDRAEGAERWSEKLDGAIAGDLALAGETLYVGALDRRIYALDLVADGEVRWSASGDGWFWARPLLVGETIYAPTTNGSVYALEARQGDRLWRFREEDSEIRARPVLSGGVLVVAMRDGVLFGLDPQTGDRLWRETLLEGSLLADPLVIESSILYVTDRSRRPDRGRSPVRVHYDRVRAELARDAPDRRRLADGPRNAADQSHGAAERARVRLLRRRDPGLHGAHARGDVPAHAAHAARRPPAAGAAARHGGDPEEALGSAAALRGADEALSPQDDRV